MVSPSPRISNFERLGWIRATDEEFDIYWASVHNVRPLFNPDNALKRLKDGQVVNHYPNHYELTRKDLMARNIKRYRRERERQEIIKAQAAQAQKGSSEPCLGAALFERVPPEWVPATYALPNDYAIFVEEFRKSPNSTWIAKPTGKAQGRGIFLVSKLNQLKRWSNAAPKDKSTAGQALPFREPYIISRYISDPLLVGGKKFDMRLYVLVTSYRPLKLRPHRHSQMDQLQQLLPIGVFFVAQKTCPQMLDGIVPDWILPYVPLLITVAAFMVMSKITSAMADKACAALVGQEAPNIELIEQASGTQTTLKDGPANTSVIDFYQNFCPACGPAAEKIEQLAGDAKYKDKVNFMLVNMGSRDDAVKYAKERNLKDAWHGHGKPPADYGIKCLHLHAGRPGVASDSEEEELLEDPTVWTRPGHTWSLLRIARNYHNTGWSGSCLANWIAKSRVLR
eukprot:s1658_g2.t1